MPRPSSGKVQVCLRLDAVSLARAGALLKEYSRPGLSVTRVDVLRVAIEEGLRVLENERKTGRGAR